MKPAPKRNFKTPSQNRLQRKHSRKAKRLAAKPVGYLFEGPNTYMMDTCLDEDVDKVKDHWAAQGVRMIPMYLGPVPE